ncbi:MAG: hypothetical protein ACKV2T_17360 [Kofleriaceae bacterium]
MRAAGLCLVAAIATTFVQAAAANAGECAPRILTSRIVTPDKATIPNGGGIVVLQSDADNKESAVTGAIKSWRFVDNRRRVAPVVREIAPGLSVLDPVGTRLDNAKRGKLRAFTRGTAAASPLAPPKVKAVKHELSAAGRRINTYVSVELDQPATADQFLVVFDKAGKVARSFGAAKTGDTRVVIYTAGECMLVPDGTLATEAQDSITLAWLDTTGQLSPRSAVVTVTSKHSDRAPGP